MLASPLESRWGLLSVDRTPYPAFRGLVGAQGRPLRIVLASNRFAALGYSAGTDTLLVPTGRNRRWCRLQDLTIKSGGTAFG